MGEIIEESRLAKRMKRPQLIAKLNALTGRNYTSQALYAWEKNNALLPSDLIMPISKLLEIDILELFGLHPSEDKKTAEYEARISELENQVSQLQAKNHKLEGKLEATREILQTFKPV